MTHSIAKGPGRLCNQIIRNIALSIVAEKFDLKAEYQSIEYMKDLGIPLIDIHEKAFKSHDDPLSLFPFRENGHYNKYGYKLVAETINILIE